MDKIKEFKKLMEKSETDKISIITNHYQILGRVYDCEESSKEFFINLTNASLCLINEIYGGETCDSYTGTHYDWLHINFDKVVAFSFIK